MQLSMDAFLTPMETPNQSIQPTAGRAAFPLSMTSTFNLQRRALSPSGHWSYVSSGLDADARMI